MIGFIRLGRPAENDPTAIFQGRVEDEFSNVDRLFSLARVGEKLRPCAKAAI
jgi:hypothetical protein